MSQNAISQHSFWAGLLAGAAGTAVGLWACGMLNSGRMIRVDRSMQIGRSAAEVFSACARIERIPQFVRSLLHVDACEDISVWTAQIDGRRLQWDVEIVQVIPKQWIGWESFRGPKHSGRVGFFPMGEETLIQVEVHYVPEISLFRLVRGAAGWDLGDAIEAALRDLKVLLESANPRQSAVPPTATHDPKQQATGT